MIAPNNADALPASLQSTYRLISSAFPDGIPDEAYWPLLALLSPGMSFRGLAEIMSYFTGIDYALIYHDVLKIDSATVKPNEAELEKTRRLLVSCGYDEWLKED
jgi:hypothetical protein